MKFYSKSFQIGKNDERKEVNKMLINSQFPKNWGVGAVP